MRILSLLQLVVILQFHQRLYSFRLDNPGLVVPCDRWTKKTHRGVWLKRHVIRPLATKKSWVSLHATTKTTTTSSIPQNLEKSTACQFCQKHFASRNALFRHIQLDPRCSRKAYPRDEANLISKATSSSPRRTKYSLALQFSYLPTPQHQITTTGSNNETSNHRPDEGKGDGDNITPTHQIIPCTNLAQCAGECLQEALEESINSYVMDHLKLDKEDCIQISGSSQSSISRLRDFALDQEGGAFAVGDTLVLNFQGPPQLTTTTTIMQALDHQPAVSSFQDGEEKDRDQYYARQFLKHVMQDTNHRLQRFRIQHSTFPNTPIIVHWNAGKLLSSTFQTAATTKVGERQPFHGERSCTQRVYHYLMPLRWLPGGSGNETAEQWSQFQPSAGISSNTRSHTPRTSSSSSSSGEPNILPQADALRKLKQFLRLSESQRFDRLYNKQDADMDGIRSSAGRFGSLGHKRKMAWHNFADSQLQGKASPNAEAVWRVLDRARMQHFILLPSNHDTTHTNQEPSPCNQTATTAITTTTINVPEVTAVLEFRGDSFLPQQIRRIVGTAVAMTHGWLPNTTMEVAMRPQVFLETPLAPPGRLYLLENRFHFDEMMAGGGKRFFESNKDDNGLLVVASEADGLQGGKEENGRGWMQTSILKLCDTEEMRRSEEDWLMDLKESTCPRIHRRLWEYLHPDKVHQSLVNRLGNAKLLSSLSSSRGTEPLYQRPLNILRRILSSQQLPETSLARSSVIKTLDDDMRNGSKLDNDSVQNNNIGSFTVVNPNFDDGVYKNGVGKDPLPLGNTLFPELVQAVFELEAFLSTNHKDDAIDDDSSATMTSSSCHHRRRPASSHCAINCNAQFSPHVDSGRGAGQSLSMIVGLGDYIGGELGVEGHFHDIRYQPLEFDGWRLRHWTQPFAGERFSLVWFTPEVVKTTAPTPTPKVLGEK